ncbi:MAG: hypothetical protein WDN69_29165 [Aliidongia sp.]
MELLQIEEPGARGDALDDAGLALGLELTGTALRLAASVGGNAELIRNAEGGIDFLPALAGYDEAGVLTAGLPGLADATSIGLDALTIPEDTDARGAAVTDRVALLITTAGRQMMHRIGRAVAGAAVVVPLDSTAGLRLALMQAIEAGGVPVLRLVEASVALAWGGGLDQRGDGAYLHLVSVPSGVALARLEVADGQVRLVGGSVARHVDELPGLIAAEAPLLGLIAPGIAGAAEIAASASVPLLDGFDGEERVVLGAALFAEAVG